VTGCDDLLAALAFGRELDAEARAHQASCPRCAVDGAPAGRIGALLAAAPLPAPAADLSGRITAAARPLLARNAARAARRSLVSAVAASLVPLPIILLLNTALVRGLHALLSGFLPEPVGFYVTFNYAVLLALLLALTYGAVPILAERQARLRYEESHA
jgi:hypothetical protein